jgi:hypothetical protein
MFNILKVRLLDIIFGHFLCSKPLAAHFYIGISNRKYASLVCSTRELGSLPKVPCICCSVQLSPSVSQLVDISDYIEHHGTHKGWWWCGVASF